MENNYMRETDILLSNVNEKFGSFLFLYDLSCFHRRRCVFYECL